MCRWAPQPTTDLRLLATQTYTNNCRPTQTIVAETHAKTTTTELKLIFAHQTATQTFQPLPNMPEVLISKNPLRTMSGNNPFFLFQLCHNECCCVCLFPKTKVSIVCFKHVPPLACEFHVVRYHAIIARETVQSQFLQLLSTLHNISTWHKNLWNNKNKTKLPIQKRKNWPVVVRDLSIFIGIVRGRIESQHQHAQRVAIVGIAPRAGILSVNDCYVLKTAVMYDCTWSQ